MMLLWLIAVSAFAYFFEKCPAHIFANLLQSYSAASCIDFEPFPNGVLEV